MIIKAEHVPSMIIRAQTMKELVPKEADRLKDYVADKKDKSVESTAATETWSTNKVESSLKKLEDAMELISKIEEYHGKSKQSQSDIVEAYNRVNAMENDLKEKINKLESEYEKVERITGNLEKINRTYNEIEEKKGLINEINIIHTKVKESEVDVDKIKQWSLEVKQDKVKVSDAITNICNREQELKDIEGDIQNLKSLADTYRGINPHQINEWSGNIQTVHTQISEVYNNIITKRQEIDSILSKQEMLKQIETNISEIKEKVNNNYLQTISENKKTIAACTSAEGMKNKVQKWIEAIESSVDKAKSTVESRGIEGIKAFYEGLEEKVYNEFIQKVSPAISSSTTTSSGIVEKMRHALSKIRFLITILQNKSEYNEILKAVTDIEKSLSKRLQSLTGQIKKPEIKKDILEYEKFKETTEKELAESILSGKDTGHINIEKAYQEYVTIKYSKHLKEFVKALEREKAGMADIGKKQQFEYDEFVKKDLNLFLDVIDRIKNIPSEFNKPLNEIFDEVGIEEIPIEIGKTKAHSSIHKIEGVKPTQYEEGTVVEVIFRGLRYKNDKSEIRKPVVIRGEKG